MTETSGEPARPRLPARGGGQACPGDPAWTVADACSYFAASGIPVTPAQLEGIIARLPGLPPAGRAPSGPGGGRGKNVYPMGSMMKLVAALAEWL